MTDLDELLRAALKDGAPENADRENPDRLVRTAGGDAHRAGGTVTPPTIQDHPNNSK
jgi:hypothetical protein